MYTIFINDVAIYLTDNDSIKGDNSFFKYDAITVDMILQKIEKNELTSICIYHEKLDFLWNDFKTYFKNIEAAGGVVFNEHNEILWIYRNNRWDLPKGKIEKGESREIAAVREVEEECGITNVKLKEYLKTTYHIYEYKEQQVLKTTYWYQMSILGNQTLTPQVEEGITKVAWLDTLSMKKVIEDTYANIKLLFND